MKKALNIFILVLVVLFTACTDDPFEDLKGSDWQKDRNVLSLLLDGQIGTSVIERNADDATIKVFAKYENIEDFSKVEVKNILLSYGASTSNDIGSTLNFDNADTTSVLSVESGAGEKLDWTISLHPFKSDLEGTWYIKEVAMYCDLFSWESWGWDKTVLITDHLPNSASELDNKLTFTVEGADENGNPFGKFIHEAGNDQEYGDFTHDTYGDYNSRFRKVIIGEGTWLRDFERNLVVLADSRGNEFEFGLSLEGNLIVESAFDPGKFDPKYVAEGGVALTAELPYTPDNFDWDTQDYLYEEIANMSKLMWYELTKEYEPQTGNSITSLVIEGQVGDVSINDDTKVVDVVIEGGVNLSSVIISELELSYGASSDKIVGDILDFSTGNTASLIVTSEAGESETWTVNVTIEVAIEGIWNVSSHVIYVEQEWGSSFTKDMSDDFPNAAQEYDNNITFVVGGDDGGKIYGKVTNDSGADGLYGDYTIPADAVDLNPKLKPLVPEGESYFEIEGTTIKIGVDSDNITSVGTILSTDEGVTLQFELSYRDNDPIWDYGNYDNYMCWSNKYDINLTK